MYRGQPKHKHSCITCNLSFNINFDIKTTWHAHKSTVCFTFDNIADKYDLESINYDMIV